MSTTKIAPWAVNAEPVKRVKRWTRRRMRMAALALMAALATVFGSFTLATASAGEGSAVKLAESTDASGAVWSSWDRTGDGVAEVAVTELNGCAIDAYDMTTGVQYTEFWGCPNAEYLAVNLGISVNAGGGTVQTPEFVESEPVTPTEPTYVEPVAPVEQAYTEPTYVEPATPVADAPAYGEYGYTYTDTELAEIREVEPDHPQVEQNGVPAGAPSLMYQGVNRGMDWTAYDRDGNGTPDVSVYAVNGCAVEVHDVKGSSDANPDPSAMTSPGGCQSADAAAGAAQYTK